MHINTDVVRALMALRGIDEPTLANIANVTTAMLSKWLHDSANGDELIAFDTQLEILRVLGINGETPRGDIVHYWRVHQDFFSSKKSFWAIDVMTETFGAADVVYFAKDTDPLAAVTARAHFGLQFQSFKAVLEVTTHPLRNIGFNPENFSDLRWADGSALVLVNREQFEKLAPGLMTPVLYDRQLTLGREQLAWERLNSLSRESKIGPEQLEHLLRNVQQGLLTPQLSAQVPNVGAEAPAEPDTVIIEQPAPVKAAAASPAPSVAPTMPPAPAPAPEPAPRPVPAAPAPAPAPAADVELEKVAPVSPLKAVTSAPVLDAVANSMDALGTGKGFVPRPRRREMRQRPLRVVPNGGAASR